VERKRGRGHLEWRHHTQGNEELSLCPNPVQVGSYQKRVREAGELAPEQSREEGLSFINLRETKGEVGAEKSW